MAGRKKKTETTSEGHCGSEISRPTEWKRGCAERNTRSE